MKNRGDHLIQLTLNTLPDDVRQLMLFVIETYSQIPIINQEY